MIYLVFVTSVLAVQNGAVLEMTGDAAKIEFGGALTLIHNATEDKLTCSGKIQASDVLIEGTSTTVADVIGEVAALRQEMAAVKAFVGMMPPSAPLPSLGFEGSSLVTSQVHALLLSFGLVGRFSTLCYSLSRDGHNATDTTFHNNCDGLGASLTIMKLDTGVVIGGYSAKSFSSDGGTVYGDAFLYSVTHGQKYPQRFGADAGALWASPHLGPTFGGQYGWDLRVNQPYEPTRVDCNPGRTYECGVPGGTTGHTGTCKLHLCNASSWPSTIGLVELEVWTQQNVRSPPLPPAPPP